MIPGPRIVCAGLVALTCSLSTLAASRIVVTAAEPVQLFVDGILVPTSIGNVRSAIPHIAPGVHTLAVHDLRGTRLHEERIMVHDGADIRIRWSPGAPFEISGAQPEVPAAANPSADLPASPDPVAHSPSEHSMPQTSSAAAGRSTAPRAPSVGEVVGAVTGSSVVGIATGAAVRGVRSLTSGAGAGTNFGPEPVASKRISEPNVVYGRVRLIKSVDAALVLYEGGMIVARLGAGPVEQDLRLEVGRRTLEVRSAADNRTLFIGDLTVEPQHHVQLSVSDIVSPMPLERPWLYKSH